MGSSHTRSGRRVVVFTVVAVAVIVGCSSPKRSGSALKAVTPTSGVTSTTTVDPTTTTVVTSDAAIIAADHVALQAYITAGSVDPVDPSDPALASYEAGTQLSRDRNLLTGLSLSHEHYIGTYGVTDSVIAQHVGNQAVVLSCATDDTAVVDDSTGTIATPSPNSQKLINDLMELVNGRWMLTDSGVRSPTC